MSSNSLQPRTASLPPPHREQRSLGELRFRPDMQIRAIPPTQGLIALDAAIVARYAGHYMEGIDLGPLVVIDTPEASGIVVDGHHRGSARRQVAGAEWRETMVDVLAYTGTVADGHLLACELNANRGLQYTGGDLIKVAEVYLRTLFTEGINPADNAVATILRIARGTVASARARLAPQFPDLPTDRIGRRVATDGRPVAIRPRGPAVPVLDMDDPEAFKAAPLPPARPLTPYQGAREYHRSNHGVDLRDTAIGALVTERRRALLAPDPVVQQGDPIALTLRWTWVDADGVPTEGTASTFADFAGLPEAVKQRIRAMLVDVETEVIA